LLANAVGQLMKMQLTHRIREQARSHISRSGAAAFCTLRRSTVVFSSAVLHEHPVIHTQTPMAQPLQNPF
jgi:hypothetical protein